jgi:YhcH/YjgK/YiaL family protein
MIVDALSNADRYAPLLPGLAEAFAFLRELPADAPDGEIEIDGQRLYAGINTYATEPHEQRRFESHERYVDVQAVLVGVERMDVAPRDGLKILEPYDADRDVTFHVAPPQFATLPMTPGVFAILWPSDAHRPNCHLTGPADVKKCVVKIRLP